jgi:hypothetical protein
MVSPEAATLARAVADAVRAVPGVAGLDPGPLGNRVTHGAQGSVDGVTVRRVDDTKLVTAHLVAQWVPLRPVLAGALAAATEALAATWPGGAWRADVEISDIAPEVNASPASAEATAGKVP